MSKRTIRNLAAGLVLLATLIVFVRYFHTHPDYWRQLRHVSRWTIVWVLLLNAAMIAILVGIGSAAIQLCGKKIPLKENFILTAYSSIANFFGPLQSGPGVRAVYLKTKYKLRLRDYTLASLIALGLFAVYNALFLLVGTRPWWQTIGAVLLVGGVSIGVVRAIIQRDKKSTESHFAVRPKILASLMIFTFLQAFITVIWYYVELKAVNTHIHFSQALSYAGAANFSLFVSITPDAIGIREAFLVFSQHIHHVSTANIASANLIDRAAYVIFLGIIFVVVLLMHGKDKLQLTKQHRQQVVADAQLH